MVRNFLFHRVNPERDKLWDPMDVKLFDKCLKYITQKYEVGLLEDLVLSGDLKTNTSYATIVFDDGYKDNIEYAAPILDKYNCKASFYVVTDCIERNMPTWTHIIEHSFQYTEIDSIDLRLDFLPIELQVTSLPGQQARLDYIKKLKPFLKKIAHEKRNTVLNKIMEAYHDIELPEIMMNWQDLRELKQAGHYIGSHTATHCMLGTMTDENEIRNELSRSGKLIEKSLGHFPKTISYPVGSYNDTTIRLSKETGYSIGLAVKQTVYDPGKDDIFEIPRIELYNEPWWKTRLRITNFLEKIKTFIRYK
jgi:peptidoglycan/xylan/chitin deacetylase (PgdA/CDA1 family)